MKMTADQILGIAGIPGTDTLRTRLNESAGGMKTFEVIEILDNGKSFEVETVQAANPVDAMVEYFGEEQDDEELKASLEKGIRKNRAGGWIIRNDDDHYIIREM